MSASQNHPTHGGYPGNVKMPALQPEIVLEQGTAEDLTHALRHLDTERASQRIHSRTEIQAEHFGALIDGMGAVPHAGEFDKASNEKLNDLIELMGSRIKGKSGDVSAALLSKALTQVIKGGTVVPAVSDAYFQAAKLCIEQCDTINESHFQQLDKIINPTTRMELADVMVEHAPKLTMLRRSKERHFSPEYTEMAITPYQRWERVIKHELNDGVYRANTPFQRMSKAADLRHMAHDALSATEFYNLTKMVIDKERYLITIGVTPPMESYTRALLDKMEQQRIQACMHQDDAQAYTWRAIRYNLMKNVQHENGYFIARELQKKYFPDVKLPDPKGPKPDPRAQEYARGR